MAIEIWYIAKAKRKFKGENKLPMIEKSSWHSVVESTPYLFWEEDSPWGKKNISEGAEINKKTLAFMDINKNGYGNVQLILNFAKGYVYIIHSRKTLKRIEKYYEIAQKLGANLYRYKTLIDEKKLNQIREEYRVKKEGRRAPKG